MALAVQPLDFYTIFVNLFAGSIDLFAIIAILVIAIIAARYRMTNVIMMLVVSLFGIIFAQWIPWLYFLVVLFGSLAIGFLVAEMVKK